MSRSLRWLASPLVFLASTYVATYLAVGLIALAWEIIYEPRLATLLAMFVAGGVFGFAVRLASWVAPVRRHWWIGLLAGLTVLYQAGLISLVGWEPSTIFGFALAVTGTLCVSLQAWPGLRPSWRNTVRWFTLSIVLATSGMALVGFSLMREADLVPGGSWVVTDPAVAFTIAFTIWGMARIAPSHRRVVVAVAALSLVLVEAHLLGVATASLTLPVIAAVVAALTGAALGTWLALRHGGAAPRSPVRAAGSSSHRYKGMTPFQDAPLDRRTFFGRERERRSLRSLVLAERLVVLFGKSGMGKTSLINAGLVEPLRRRGYFPMVVRLADRGRDPLESLLERVKEAARAAGVDQVGGDETSALSYFRTAEFWSERDDMLRPVLILDQFEELFTLHAPGPRREFIRQLAELVRGPAAADLKIVLSLREDFLADLEELSRDIPGVLRHRFRLGAFGPEAARRAIVGPAGLPDEEFDTPSFRYHEDAVDRIIAFLARRRQGTATVEGAEVEPAHLQLVCRYLEESVRDRTARGEADAGREITAAELGGEDRLGRILEGFYDRILDSIRSARERRRVRKLCERRLISEAGRRLTEDGEQIERKLGVSTERLRQLVDVRLLRSEPRLGGTFYELSHDTLVEPIRRSRAKRRMRRRGLAVGTALALVGWVGLWLSSVGWAAIQEGNEESVLSQLTARLPDPGDERAFEEIARERLRTISENRSEWIGSRKLYGAMIHSIEEVRRLYPGLARAADRARAQVRREFVAAHGIGRPPESESRKANSLFAVPEMKRPGGSDLGPFTIQGHQVTHGEYRRFDPTHGFRGVDNQPAHGMSGFEAVAYADWLGGRLPKVSEWRWARFVIYDEGPSLARFGEIAEWVARDPDAESDWSEHCGVVQVDDSETRAKGHACQDDSRSVGFRVVFRPGPESGNR